jgi:hypothetical protein
MSVAVVEIVRPRGLSASGSATAGAGRVVAVMERVLVNVALFRGRHLAIDGKPARVTFWGQRA